MSVKKEDYKNKTIGILAGGLSGEREVSLRSGKTVHDALQHLGYNCQLIDPKFQKIEKGDFDIAFIALHGKFGEDGTIQKELAQLNIPFTGSGIQASERAMNKITSKKIMQKHKIPTASFSTDLNTPLDYPFVVKPIAEGSSIGIHIIHSETEWHHWLDSHHDHERFFIEDFIEGRDITVGIIEEDGKPIALPPLEMKPKREFYDYTAKYTEGETTFIIPSTMTASETETAKTLAIKLHHVLGCKGLSRTDMRLSKKEGVLILELNTIPGLTTLSDLPAQAKAAGYSVEKLIETILLSVQ